MLFRSIEGANSYNVLKNGQTWKTTSETSIDITEAVEYQVMAVDKNNIASFASEPVQVYPVANVQTYQVEKFATPSDKPYQGFTGTGFVEINRTTNRLVNVGIDVPADGMYVINWLYSNGNGPTNTENKCAIRTLKMDGVFAGTVVFPQRGSDEWSNWGYSNGIQLQLAKGKHNLALSFEAENENMNIEVNQAMLDAVKLVRIR